MRKFSAPWGMRLILQTIVFSLALVGSAAIGVTFYLLAYFTEIEIEGTPLSTFAADPAFNIIFTLSMIVTPLLVFFYFVWRFTLTGYEVGAGVVRVCFPTYTRSISLAGLTAAEADPLAMKGTHWPIRKTRWDSINGVFSYGGRCRSKKLGDYLAYATNSENAVVLFVSGRKVVLTPNNPASFIKAVKRASGLGD